MGDYGELRGSPPITGARAMKPVAKRSKPESLGEMAIKAMRRAVRRARKTARLHGVPVHIWRDGRVIVDRS